MDPSPGRHGYGSRRMYTSTRGAIAVLSMMNAAQFLSYVQYVLNTGAPIPFRALFCSVFTFDVFSSHFMVYHDHINIHSICYIHGCPRILYFVILVAVMCITNGLYLDEWSGPSGWCLPASSSRTIPNSQSTDMSYKCHTCSCSSIHH